MIAGRAAAEEIARRRAGRHLLLLLDFDGTLVPFHSDPAAVRLDPVLAAQLGALANRPGVSVGIVSGRRLADLQELVSIPGDVFLAGCHGLELLGPGDRFVHPGAAAAGAAVQETAARIRPRIADLRGVFIEDKGLSIALHYREAAWDAADAATSILVDAARPDIEAGRLRLLPGANVLELLPAAGWHKGTAVGWIRDRVERLHGATLVVYIGDDVTDEDAFRAVGPAGIAIAASDRAQGAALRVDGPEGVARLLHSLDGSEDNRRA